MCKLKFCWFKISMTTNDKNQKESTRKIISKVERIFQSSNSLFFCVLKPIQIYHHRMYCAEVEHAAKHFAMKFCQISQGTKSLFTVYNGHV